MNRGIIPNLQPKPGQKMDMRVVKTREAIAEAFVKLLETTEYTDITVTAIAREARISRKTFYLHYNSTDELLRQMIEANVAEIVAEVGARDLGLEAADALKKFTSIVFNVLVHHPYLNSNLVRCMPLHSFLDMAKEPLVALITEHFEEAGIAKPAYFDYWVSYYLGGLCSVYEMWKLNDGDPASLEKLAKVVGSSVAQTFENLVRSSQAGALS